MEIQGTIQNWDYSMRTNPIISTLSTFSISVGTNSYFFETKILKTDRRFGNDFNLVTHMALSSDGTNTYQINCWSGGTNSLIHRGTKLSLFAASDGPLLLLLFTPKTNAGASELWADKLRINSQFSDVGPEDILSEIKWHQAIPYVQRATWYLSNYEFESSTSKGKPKFRLPKTYDEGHLSAELISSTTSNFSGVTLPHSYELRKYYFKTNGTSSQDLHLSASWTVTVTNVVSTSRSTLLPTVHGEVAVTDYRFAKVWDEGGIGLNYTVTNMVCLRAGDPKLIKLIKLKELSDLTEE